MKIKNTTDFPDSKIREIIAFVKPNNLPTSKFDVRVTNCSGSFTGKAYVEGYNSERPHIILRISSDETKFPKITNYDVKYRSVKLYWEQFNERTEQYEEWHGSVSKPNPSGNSKGYINSLMLSRTEALVHIAAHELRHLWQKNHKGKRGKVWGARSVFSDRDADAYAIKKVREWRRLNTVDAIYLSFPIC